MPEGKARSSEAPCSSKDHSLENHGFGHCCEEKYAMVSFRAQQFLLYLPLLRGPNISFQLNCDFYMQSETLSSLCLLERN